MFECGVDGRLMDVILFEEPSTVIFSPAIHTFIALNSVTQMYACASNGCVPLTSRTVQLPLRAAGDYVRLVDTQYHTHEWVVWGHPAHFPFASDVVHDIVVDAHADAVWMHDTHSAYGLVFDANAWQIKNTLTVDECLADLFASGPLHDMNASQVAHMQLMAVVSPTGTHEVAFARWIPHTLPCDTWSTDALLHTTHSSVPIYDRDTSSDAFWTYAVARENSSCTRDEFQRHVSTIMSCLLAPPWALPFMEHSGDASLLQTQRLDDWSLPWQTHYGTQPLFVCTKLDADTTQFHSIILTFLLPDDHSNDTHVRISPLPPPDIDALFEAFGFDESLIACPALFLV
jgi:hypothetical protein